MLQTAPRVTHKFVKGFLLFTLTLLSTQAQAGCWWWESCDEYETENPIVLVHGLSGFDSILGVDYFYRVQSVLEARGAEVYAPNVSAFNDSYERGEQLIVELEEVRAISGASKFNLIGHSQGGPTIRYVAGVRPDLVASVTTVNAVNFGSDFADVVRGVVPSNSPPEVLIATVANLLGTLIDTLAGNPEHSEDALDSLAALTTAGADEFNALFPDGQPSAVCGEGERVVNGISYYSWGGSSEFTNLLDVADPLLVLTGSTINAANDGLVERCDQHWGKVIKSNYRMNHMDAVNQTFGIHHLFETDPLTVYKNHAIRLKNTGL